MTPVVRTGMLAAAFAIMMVGAAYASVPLYKMFCAVTGFDGTTQRAQAAELPTAAQLVALHGKTVNVRFDGNVAAGLPWDFHPVKAVETVKIGERRLAFFRATNNSDKPITGQAAFNVAPSTAGRFFDKIDCFCFTEQTLQPGETVDMPVVYFVDPKMLNDANGRRIDEITLSYTFFPVDTPNTTGQKPRATT